METKNREKLLLVLVGASLALLLLNMLVITPLTSLWHDRSAEIARLRKQITEGAMLIRRDSAVRSRWEAMQANALPNNATSAERQMFTSFDHWVRTGAVTEGSFRPQVQEGETAAYSTVDCRGDVTGSLSNIRDFLRAMSKDPLANKVASFEVTSKDDNGQQLTLALNLGGLMLTNAMAGVPSAGTTLALNTVPTDPKTDPFQILWRNNIFNQSRRPTDTAETGPRVRVERLACCGVAFDNGIGSASFEGTSVNSTRLYQVGDAVNRDFKIAKINSNYTVTLTNAESNSFVLSSDKSVTLRRENGGDWRRTGYTADDTAEAAPAATDASSPASSAGDNDIIARLKRQREKELQ
jgi:hypothetical protein